MSNSKEIMCAEDFERIFNKETMVGMTTKRESRRKNTIHTMRVNVMCATCGKRKEKPMKTNNKHREALEATNKFLETAIINGKIAVQDITALRDIVSAARSEPIRNGEVGTADEQYERWRVFCGRYAPVCAGCPCESDRSLAYCFARWAQMPYEEGGAK